MVCRTARLALLGLHLAASVLAVALPHSGQCAATPFAPHDYDAEHAPCAAVSCDAEHGHGHHPDDCAACKFLGQRTLAPLRQFDPPPAGAAAMVVVSLDAPVVLWPRSPHDPRGPPLG